MASNRHLGRVIVLQSLYEYELRTLAGDPDVDLDTVIAKNIAPYEKTLGDTEFVYNLAHRVVENFETLDNTLQPMAPEWPISSISAIDRNVLRIGLYELSDGVLGTAYKELGIVEENESKKNHKSVTRTNREKKAEGTGSDTDH